MRRLLFGLVVVLGMMIVSLTAISAQAPANCVNKITVWDNESLNSIARREGVNVNDLAALNGLTVSSRLQIGQVLCLDGLKPALPASPVATTPAPTTPAPGTGGVIVTPTRTPAPTTAPATTATPAAPRTGFMRGQNPVVPAGWRTHNVAVGDNLFKISQMYGLTVQAVASANNITNTSIVFLNETLLIPPSGTAATPVPATPPPATPIPATPAPVTGPATTTPPVMSFSFRRGQNAAVQAGWRTHNVTAGDNLFKISQMYGVTALSIAQANNIANPSIVYLGETLLIPPGSGAPIVTPAAPVTSTPAPTAAPATSPATATPAPSTGAIATPPNGASTIPVIGLNPVRAIPGATITVTGSNFPPNSRVEIFIERPSAGLKSGVLGTVTSGADGTFSYNLTIPAAWGNGQAVVERIVSVSGYAPGGYWGMNYFVNPNGQ